jgi:formylglycine-generating enzyme required for sulfatase activity
MSMNQLRLLAVIVGTAVIAWAADDPLVGTWRLNVSKSKFTPGPAPKEETRVYDAQGDGIKVTVRTVEGDGHTTTIQISANYDGKDYPVTGSSEYDAITKLTKINERASEATLMHGDRVIATARREVSPDGKTMTITYKTPQGQDHPISNQAVYDKQ